MTKSANSISPWVVVAILTVMYALSYLDRQVIGLLAEPIMRDLEITDLQMGVLQGVAFGLFYAIAGLPLGWAVDRYSRRLLVFGGIMFWSFATIACGFAQNYGQLTLARFAVGVGEASLAPAAFSLIADVVPRRRLGMALGIFGGGAAIGTSLALALGGWLLHIFEGKGLIIGGHSLAPWRSIFVVVGAPGLLIAFSALLLPKIRRDNAGTVHGSWSAFFDFFLAHRLYLFCHFAGFGFIIAAGFALSAWSATFMARHFEMSLTRVGAFLGAMNMTAHLLGFVGSGWLADRWFSAGRADAHLRLFAIAGALIMVFSAAAFLAAPTVSSFLVCWFFLGLQVCAVGPAASHLQIVTPPELRGRMSAAFGMCYISIGMMVGPPAVGYLTTKFFADPMQIGTSLAVTCMSVGLVACLLLSTGLAPARKAVQAAKLREMKGN